MLGPTFEYYLHYRKKRSYTIIDRVHFAIMEYSFYRPKQLGSERPRAKRTRSAPKD
jgi:hypothetical protein